MPVKISHFFVWLLDYYVCPLLDFIFPVGRKCVFLTFLSSMSLSQCFTSDQYLLIFLNELVDDKWMNNFVYQVMLSTEEWMAIISTDMLQYL